MYSRIMRMRILPGKMELTVSIMQRSVVPVLRNQKGFVNIMLMENRDRNELVSFTFWETERDMLALERSDFLEQQMWKLNTVLAELVTPMHYKHRLPVQMASKQFQNPDQEFYG